MVSLWAQHVVKKDISKGIDIFFPFNNYMSCVNVAAMASPRLKNVNDLLIVPTLVTTVFLKKDEIILWYVQPQLSHFLRNCLMDAETCLTP